MDGTLLNASRTVISNCLARFRNSTALIYDHSDGAIVLAREVSQIDPSTPVVVVCEAGGDGDDLGRREQTLDRLGLRNRHRINLCQGPVRRLDTGPMTALGLTFFDGGHLGSALRNFDAVLFHPGKYIQMSPGAANVIMWREPHLGFAPLIHWTRDELAAEAHLPGPMPRSGARPSLATCNGVRLEARLPELAFSS